MSTSGPDPQNGDPRSGRLTWPDQDRPRRSRRITALRSTARRAASKGDDAGPPAGDTREGEHAAEQILHQLRALRDDLDAELSTLRDRFGAELGALRSELAAVRPTTSPELESPAAFEELSELRRELVSLRRRISLRAGARGLSDDEVERLAQAVAERVLAATKTAPPRA